MNAVAELALGEPSLLTKGKARKKVADDRYCFNNENENHAQKYMEVTIVSPLLPPNDLS